MKKIKWLPLLLAFLATACMAGIGIAVAERSIVGITGSMILLIFIMGFGFMQKKKMRENGIL
ncbi:YlaF family protein [Bacillus tuaregi]|uniref:YlaF family protein n=1 Tax=Bacillus tuaregi TaxID=1816695 RepID=UPI0008F8D1B6|nr:YlaF family protein [Bacillus tuaregi]